MIEFSKFLPFAFGASLLLAACGGDSSSTSSESGTDVPDKPSFSVSSCKDATDPDVASKLEDAKSGITDILMALGEGNFKNAQTVSAKTKNSFKSILDKHPANCEAQLGYALSIVTDLVNNNEIKAFVDTIANKQNLLDMNVEDMNQILIAGNGKHITKMAQEAVAEAIPSLDSAIIYMNNIVGDDKFTCDFSFGDRTYELDRGEFAPTLSALYIAKAVLTFGASVNIDISANNRYDWLNDSSETNQIQNSTAQQIISLMNKESAFTTIYSNRKSSYRKIPNLLDSAITYIELGLQYGIDESKSGSKTQLNDPYIVGDDEMSDVSAADFKKAIDSLEHYRQGLRTGVTVTLPHGSKIKINVAKFFDITDGWQDYLPYHKFNDVEKWNIPEDGFYWTDKLDYHTYVEIEVSDILKEETKKKMKFDYFSAWLDSYYIDEDRHSELCIDIELYKDDYDYYFSCFEITMDKCTMKFEARTSYDDDETTIQAPAPIQLSSGVCKVENGKPLFARAYQELIPNSFYFTDAKGKKTISYQALVNGKLVDDDVEDYTLDEIEKLIFFPDITFGGILPDMTTDSFWAMLKKENSDDD